MPDFHATELYQITKCRDCPNAVVNTEQMAKACAELFKEMDFTGWQLARLGGAKPKHHDIFSVAIAGCPNSCSQPQIKDFGLQGQAVPEVGEGCTGCGLCVAACPDQGILLGEKGPQIDPSLCLNCGKCARCCPTGAITISKQGYRVMRGGKLGRRPRLAEEVCSLTDEQGALQWLRQTIELLKTEGRPGERERLGALLERIGKKNNKDKPK
ncbi:4Fe-4S dicluster domain-containing protein [Desulforamulus putei]|uniref:4Fe-4S dicluster domain-containing protein n=1 Tax=Desulforamulus putei DSM 12395 TaxID=1121429 RepID=A0A1M5BL15_9FIRM|nr:4Fe-4S dicluster domain-containing protein [Desulforamulus putei]SHF42902.1 4Fe-4S dicluster domain-containing protein [Desulforamulus putei DSM 12395]